MQGSARLRALAVVSLALGACGSRDGASSSTFFNSAEFRVLAIDLDPSGVSQLNRPIAITFSRAVDFATVSASAISVVDELGAPAVGELRAVDGDPRVIVFQPRCPMLADSSDTGLHGATTYELAVTSLVHAIDGAALAHEEHRSFETPDGFVPAELFFDPIAAPPSIVVRDAGVVDEHASYVELGDGTRAWFERDAQGAIALPLELPLNLYSDTSTHVAFVAAFDQSIDPAPTNLARIELEFRGDVGTWQPLAREVELLGNCEPSGALVRVEPRGALPPRAELRVVLRAGFSDLVGNSLVIDGSDLSGSRTSAAPTPLIDDVLEDFGSNELEDAGAMFAEPRALWGYGELVFSGGDELDGAGDFDWFVPPGLALLSTSHATLIGGPGFAPTTQREFEGGELHVRNLKIASGATLRVEGPNPLAIYATGDVQIDGVIDASGVSNIGVMHIGSSYRGPHDIVDGPTDPGLPLPLLEPGAPGQAGGGRGGDGNPLELDTAAYGGGGHGAFDARESGGLGGETGWADVPDINKRRGAGGGGGRLGRDVPAVVGTGAFDQRRIGLDAEKGFDALLASNGGAHPGMPPRGGSIGASPFADADPSNDFFGLALDRASGSRTIGELAHPWAGAGGGAGGDGAKIFAGGAFPPPTGVWGIEHGAGGGGGGGSLRIVALGVIRFGVSGQVVARGGAGGTGQNSIFLNHVGGAGGGGSGGHVILESAQRIEFAAPLGSNVAILATGGQGGAGANNVGGAWLGNNGVQETPHGQDACPPGYSTSGANACKGHIDGAGGDGGPGVIQLHVPRGIDDVVLPPGKSLADVCQPPPLCDWGSAHLVPSVALRSRARSKWIALGRGGFDASTALDHALDFEFAGNDPSSGGVIVNGDVPWLAPAMLGPSVVQHVPGVPRIAHYGRALIVDASAWIGTDRELLLTRTDLLRHAVILLRSVSSPSIEQRFDVVAAERIDTTTMLTLYVDGDGPRLDHFAGDGPIEASLHPSWLRVATDGVDDQLVSPAWMRVGFQLTTEDAHGAPEVNGASELLYDADALDAYAMNGAPRFVRFDVLLAAGADLAVPGVRLPSLDFLRLRLRW